MNNAEKMTTELIEFINKSPTAFHAVEKARSILSDNGFEELAERGEWLLEKEGRYFVRRNDSALIAFIVGKGEIGGQGFKLIGAHTDSPGFRIKPVPEIVEKNTYLKLNTEAYGGPIDNTWLDRPLSLAGRVTLRSNNIMYPEKRLVYIDRPLLIIPNLAIHLNREVNKGVELNRQKDLLPLLALISKNLEVDNYLKNILAGELDTAVDDILDFDIFLAEYEKGSLVGANQEFISAGRLDDLAMVHAGLKAITASAPAEGTNVLVLFDNEEIGSSTRQGADSPMLSHLLERIVYALGKDRGVYLKSLTNSFMISADMAHALHPNFVDKHDPVNQPLINQGPVIKINANQRYTSDSDSISVYEQICKQAGVPVQKFVNRSDQRGGSTIGPISASQIGIRSLDIGNPVLGMHSIRELAGIKDHNYVISSFKEYYRL